MHTVTELNTFRKAALNCGMSEIDIESLISFLAKNPYAGDEISGSGGCRKVRFKIAGNNKGKSGGVRTITLFSGTELPVFLITVFSKSQKVAGRTRDFKDHRSRLPTDGRIEMGRSLLHARAEQHRFDSHLCIENENGAVQTLQLGRNDERFKLLFQDMSHLSKAETRYAYS